MRPNSSSSRLRVTSDTFMAPSTGSDEGEETSGNYDSEGVASENGSDGEEERARFGDNLTRIQLPNKQVRTNL